MPTSGPGNNLPKIQPVSLNAAVDNTSAVSDNSKLPQSKTASAKNTKVNKDPSLLSPQATQGIIAAAGPQIKTAGGPANIQSIIANALKNPTLSSSVMQGLGKAGANYNGETEFPGELAESGLSTKALQAFGLAAQQTA